MNENDEKSSAQAERLRMAARLLRIVATGTSSGKWMAYRDCGLIGVRSVESYAPVCTDAEDDAQWIAMMSPSLAVPLALWLEKTAECMDGAGDWVAVEEAARVADHILWQPHPWKMSDSIV